MKRSLRLGVVGTAALSLAGTRAQASPHTDHEHAPANPVATGTTASSPPGAVSAPEVGPRDRVARTSGRFGVDFRLGLSNGMIGAPATIGIDLSYAPWAPVVLFAGVDANGATVAGHVDAQVNLLTFFARTPWTPFLRAGYSQLWFTDLADEILDASAPELRDDLAEVGTDLRFSGVHLHLVHVGGGIDLVSRGGFHFQMLLGRSFMVGESHGRNAEESIELTEYQSWNFAFAMGVQFL